MPNKELAQALQLAKRAKPEKRMFFALVLKGGGAKGVLLVSRRKVPKTRIESAKKQSGGTAVVSGTCYLGDQGKVVFETPKSPATRWKTLVREIAQKEAGVTLQAEFVQGKSENDYQEPQLEERDNEEPEVDPLAGKWQERADAMAGRVQTALGEFGAGPHKFLRQRYDRAVEEAQEGSYESALKGLDAVEELIVRFQKSKDKGVTKEDYQQALKEQLRHIGPLLDELNNRAPKRAAPLVKEFQRLENACSDDAVESEMLAAAEELERNVRSALASKHWQESIDISHYTQGQELGSGGQGRVYALNRTSDDDPPLVFKSFHSMKGLKQEVEYYEKVGDHPNIARVLGRQTINGEPGMVMESLPGGDMKGAMKQLSEQLKQGQIKQEEYWGAIQHSLIGMLQGLDHMHGLGIRHNDVKPENLMYDGEGNVKLMDMGGAIEEGQRAPAYTPGYITHDGLEGDPKGDVFAVGSSTFRVGEKESFNYNVPKKPGDEQNQYAWMLNAYQYAESAKGDNPMRPLQPGSEDRPSSKVVNPKGDREKQPGVHGVGTDYVDFVNWLMHPDPKKRPTPREALEHPFLKNRLLDDESARQVIRGMKEPRQPDPNRAPPRQERAPQVKRPDISKLRPLIDKAVRLAPTWRQRLRTIQGLVDQLQQAPEDLGKCWQMYGDLGEFYGSFRQVQLEMQAAVKALRLGKPEAGDPNDPEVVQDRQNLQTLSALHDDLRNIINPLVEAYNRVGEKPHGSKSTKQLSRLARHGQLYRDSDLDRSEKIWMNQQERLQAEINQLRDNPSPVVEERQATAERLDESLKLTATLAQRELDSLLKVIKQFTDEKPGIFTSKEDTEQYRAAVPRLARARRTLSLHVQGLKQMRDDVERLATAAKQALDTARTQRRQAMKPLETLQERLQGLEGEYAQASETFRKVAGKPRQERQNQLEQARNEFFQAIDRIAEQAPRYREQTPAVRDHLQKRQQDFQPGGEGSQGDWEILEEGLKRLRKVDEAFAQLLTRIESDKQAYRDLSNEKLRENVGEQERPGARSYERR
jgi:serine/threonine protein kinase